jgi:hypothetical protein
MAYSEYLIAWQLLKIAVTPANPTCREPAEYSRLNNLFFLLYATTFVVTDGKLTYAETGDEGVRQEFSVSGFKKAIVETVEKE